MCVGIDYNNLNGEWHYSSDRERVVGLGRGHDGGMRERFCILGWKKLLEGDARN